MADPVTLATLTVGAISTVAANPIVQNVVGSRADSLLMALGAVVKERVSGQDGSLPNNHDVERAIRLAHVQALKATTAAYLAEAPKDADRQAFGRRMSGWLGRQVTLAGVDADWPATSTLIDNIDAVLSGDRAGNPSSLKDLAEAAAWSELELWTRENANSTAPEGFRAMFFGKGQKSGWYAAFGAFVAEGIKDNERFRSVFTATKLADISSAIGSYAIEGAKQAKSLETQIAQAQKSLEAIQIDTDLILRGVGGIKQLLEQLVERSPTSGLYNGNQDDANFAVGRSVARERRVTDDANNDSSLNGRWRIAGRYRHPSALTKSLLIDGRDTIFFSRDVGAMKWSTSEGISVVMEKSISPSTEVRQDVGFLGFEQRTLLFGNENGDIVVYGLGERLDPVGEPEILKGHTAKPKFIAFSDDASRLLSIDSGNQALIWDWATKSPISTFRSLTGPTMSGSFAHQAPRVTLISEAGEIELFDLKTGRSLGRLKADVAGVGCTARFSWDDKQIVARDEADRWDVFDARSFERVAYSDWRMVFVEATVSRSKTTVLYYTADGVVGVGDIDQAAPSKLLAPDLFPPLELRADAAAISDDGALVAIRRDQSIDLWERNRAG